LKEAIEALTGRQKLPNPKNLQPILISLLNSRKVDIVNTISFIAEVHNQQISSLSKAKAECINILEEFFENHESELAKMGIFEVEAIYSLQKVYQIYRNSTDSKRNIAVTFLNNLLDKEGQLSKFFYKNPELQLFLKSINIEEEKTFLYIGYHTI
jgi:hypothetical protein